MSIVYLNNKYFSKYECNVSPDDRGFLLGDGLFETMRIYSGKVTFLKNHWDRLVRGSHALGINLPLSFKKLNDIMNELIEKNLLKDKEASVRMTITRGVGCRGLGITEGVPSTVYISTNSVAGEKPLVTAHISKMRKNEHSPLSNIKSLNYLENILALRNARKMGFDEAILLNTKGKVSESTTSNLFFVKNKTLYTPSIKDGALMGITRKIILYLAEQIDIPVKVTSIYEPELLSSDEVFLTNSLSGIRALTEINGILIGSGLKGEITEKLERKFFEYVNSY